MLVSPYGGRVRQVCLFANSLEGHAITGYLQLVNTRRGVAQVYWPLDASLVIAERVTDSNVLATAIGVRFGVVLLICLLHLASELIADLRKHLLRYVALPANPPELPRLRPRRLASSMTRVALSEIFANAAK